MVLGGGLAGLAFAFYATSRGLSTRMFEASNRLGGACVTFRWQGFSFDSGAHRVHDKDPHTTRDLHALLGDDLLRVGVPSAIFDRGRFLPFPFGLVDLVRLLGPGAVGLAVCRLIASRASRRRVQSFEDAAVRRFGADIAGRFLLNYSQKLWGTPCRELVPEVSGGRLKGLDVHEALRETIRIARGTRHMEGTFFYPRHGIGMLTDRLASGSGGTASVSAPVTKVFHDGRRVTAVEVNGRMVETSRVVSTIPLDRLIGMLEPPPPAHVRAAAGALRYRNVVLVALFLATPSITSYATVYFPDAAFPFTRVVEPRNRSPLMSPPGHTSLVAEIPCWQEDEAWVTDDDRLVRLVRDHLERLGWVKPDRVVGAMVERVAGAYPVTTLRARDAVRAITEWVSQIEGVYLLGRAGTFRYAWIHDLMRDSRLLAEELARVPDRQRRSHPG